MDPWAISMWIWGVGTILLLGLALAIAAGDGWVSFDPVFLGLGGSFALIWPMMLLSGLFGFALFLLARRHRRRRRR